MEKRIRVSPHVFLPRVGSAWKGEGRRGREKEKEGRKEEAVEGGFNEKHLYLPPPHERTLNPIKTINRLSVALRRKFTLFPAPSRLVWRVGLARPVFFFSRNKNKNKK